MYVSHVIYQRTCEITSFGTIPSATQEVFSKFLIFYNLFVKPSNDWNTVTGGTRETAKIFFVFYEKQQKYFSYFTRNSKNIFRILRESCTITRLYNVSFKVKFYAFYFVGAFENYLFTFN